MSEVLAFVKSVRADTPPVVSGAEARRALEVALRITAGMGEPPRAPAGLAEGEVDEVARVVRQAQP